MNLSDINYGKMRIKIHAEIDAYIKMSKFIKRKEIKTNKMNLIVIRTNKSGTLCNSAPCYNCTLFLSKNKEIEIDKLYYSTSDGKIDCIKFSDWKKNGTNHLSEGWKFIKKNNLCYTCSI